MKAFIQDTIMDLSGEKFHVLTAGFRDHFELREMPTTIQQDE
jgi:hypothetical protein